jgi:hypothetical protein
VPLVVVPAEEVPEVEVPEVEAPEVEAPDAVPEPPGAAMASIGAVAKIAAATPARNIDWIFIGFS